MCLKQLRLLLVLIAAFVFVQNAGAASAASVAQVKSVLPRLTESDKKIWKTTLKFTVMRPPCCGACGLFTMADARELWGYLTGEKPTARGEALWRSHAKKLLAEFSRESPDRYKKLYQGLKLPEENSL